MGETMSENTFFDEYSYPNTVYFVIVRDLENGDEWFTTGHGPLILGDLNIVNSLECFWNNLIVPSC